MIRSLFSVILSVAICVLCVLSAYGADSQFQKKRIYICKNEPFSRQVKTSNTIYIIKNNINLDGETIEMPDNSVILIKKGGLKNGKLQGDYRIEAKSVQILENVDISDCQYPIKFSWIVGNRRELYNEDFLRLPSSVIDFENNNFIAKEVLVLDKLREFSFANLNLTTEYSIHYWPSSLIKGECSPIGTVSSYCGMIKLNNDIPKEYEGYIIEITTADRTKYDFRPDTNGVPSLYKGITSRISSINHNIITISDSLEYFSSSRLYNGHFVKAIFRIYRPRKFVLSNCHFVFNNINSGISLRGCDFLIENSSFIAKEGCNTILSIGGHKGIIKNSIVNGANYQGTNSSYGIQIVNGTNFLIENCTFSENRRGVDFSGTLESRYNEVRNCSFYQKENLYKSGSAIGGHSTSYGNVMRKNRIIGEYQVGIQCRGENEIVDDNYFNCTAATMVVFAYNTKIINNLVVTPSKYSVSTFTSSGIQEEGNSLYVINNTIDVRRLLISGDENIKYYVEGNTIQFSPNASSVEPVIFLRKPKEYRLKDNKISNKRDDTQIKLIQNGAVIK